MVFVNTCGIEQLKCGKGLCSQNTTVSGSFWRAPPERISKIVPRGKLKPHILPHVKMTTPTMFPVDKKSRGQKKSRTNVLIPF